MATRTTVPGQERERDSERESGWRAWMADSVRLGVLCARLVRASALYALNLSPKAATRAACEALVRENLLAIKLFQYLSSFTQEFSAETLSVFAQYRDRADFDATRDIDGALLREVLRKYDIRLCNSEMPINSGSIAVVYKGWLRGAGEKAVVVKLKKRGVDAHLQRSAAQVVFLFEALKRAMPWIRRAQWLWRLLGRRGADANAGANGTDIEELLEPFVDNLENLRQQCDFAREVRSMRATRTEMQTLRSYIRIPECFNDAEDSARADLEFIVMECMNGVTFAELTRLFGGKCGGGGGGGWRVLSDWRKMDGVFSAAQRAEPDTFKIKYRYAKALLIYCYYSALFGSCVHVDMHFGNLLFADTLQVIDFGMTEYLDASARKPIQDVLKLSKEIYARRRAAPQTQTQTEDEWSDQFDMVKTLSPCFTTDLEVASAHLSPAARRELSRALFVLLVRDVIMDGNISEAKLYEVMRQINRSFRMAIRFRREYYNMILGVAMTVKGTHNLLEFRSELNAGITQEAIEYLFCEDEDEDEGEDEAN